MVKDIVFFGAGAIAAELTSYLCDSDWGNSIHCQIKGYVGSVSGLEDSCKKYGFESPFLGDVSNYRIEKNDYFVIATSDCKMKPQIVEYIRSKGGKFITLVHPTAIISKNSKIGEGNVFSPFTMLGPNVVIGDFNLLTSQSIISHDSRIGNYNFLATSLLCGHNDVGDKNFFGIRSTTVPEITIGNDNVIQAGMIVDRNVGDGSTVFYRYKEKIIAIPH